MFEPQILPADPQRLATAVQDELRRLALTLAQPADYAALKTLHAAPKRIFDGMLVLADGTDWDPGSGAGLYARRAGAWVFIG